MRPRKRMEFRFIDERSLRTDLSFMISICNIGLRCLCFPAENADGEKHKTHVTESEEKITPRSDSRLVNRELTFCWINGSSPADKMFARGLLSRLTRPSRLAQYGVKFL